MNRKQNRAELTLEILRWIVENPDIPLHCMPGNPIKIGRMAAQLLSNGCMTIESVNNHQMAKITDKGVLLLARYEPIVKHF